MAAAVLPIVTVDEYLGTSYSPDRDYVDGALEERSLGTHPHSSVQHALQMLLQGFAKSHNIRVLPEQRVQTGLTRFRVPDVCVTLGRSKELVFRLAPFLCVEILSPDDRLSKVEVRAREYLDMGVRFVWILNPVTHESWSLGPNGLSLVEGVLRTQSPDLEIVLDELWDIAEN